MGLSKEFLFELLLQLLLLLFFLLLLKYGLLLRQKFFGFDRVFNFGHSLLLLNFFHRLFIFFQLLLAHFFLHCFLTSLLRFFKIVVILVFFLCELDVFLQGLFSC